MTTITFNEHNELADELQYYLAIDESKVWTMEEREAYLESLDIKEVAWWPLLTRIVGMIPKKKIANLLWGTKVRAFMSTLIGYNIMPEFVLNGIKDATLFLLGLGFEQGTVELIISSVYYGGMTVLSLLVSLFVRRQAMKFIHWYRKHKAKNDIKKVTSRKMTKKDLDTVKKIAKKYNIKSQIKVNKKAA